MKSFVANLPKAELHMHLEGALTPSLVRSLAKRNNLPVPSSISTMDTTSGWAFHDLTSFLAIYYPSMAVLRTATDFHDLAWDYLKRARAQRILHVEMFFDPQAHTGRGVPFNSVIRGYRAAIVRAEREFGMSASLIMCFLRDMSAEFAMATLMESLQYKDWIIGVGLDSDERDNPPAKFKDVFHRAQEEGFLLTMHCDIDQNNSIEHIRQAVDEIGVHRVDHGTNVVENEDLVEVLKKKGIGLTCCPVSNSVVSSDFKGKEILELLRKGVKVTINSDDPAYFRAYMSENMEKMVEGTDITKKELVQLQRNAFEISWVSNWRRNHFLQMLDDYAKKHEVEGASNGVSSSVEEPPAPA